MTFSEELKSAKDNQDKIDETIEKALAEIVKLTVSKNKAIVKLTEIDLGEMLNVGSQNVASLSTANAQHSWAQYYRDYNNIYNDEDREEEKALLAAVNKLYNPNADNNVAGQEKSTVGQIADILSEGAKTALTDDVGDLKDLFSIYSSDSKHTSGAPYGEVTNPFEGDLTGGMLEKTQDKAAGGGLDSIVSSDVYEGTFNVELISTMRSSSGYNLGKESKPNDSWPYSGNDANSNMLIRTSNGSGVGLAAWTPINSSVPQNTRVVDALSSGQVSQAEEFFKSFTGENVKYSYGFSFSMKPSLTASLAGIKRSFYYSREDAERFNSSKNPTSDMAAVNSIEHSERWILSAKTGYQNDQGENNVKSMFTANVNRKLFNSYLNEDDKLEDPDYYKASGWALTQTPSTGLWRNGYDIHKPGSPTNKQMKVGDELKEIKSEQEMLTTAIVATNSTSHKHSSVTADVIGASYNYTTPNQKANVNYLISHESSDFMSNMFTCWIEDGDGDTGALYNFGDTIENTYTQNMSENYGVPYTDSARGALQFTFGVKKINVPMPIQGTETSSICGIPYVIAGGKAPTIKRRASLDVASDQMDLIYGTIYNFVSLHRIRPTSVIYPKSFFTVIDAEDSSQKALSLSNANTTKLNICILIWTDNKLLNYVLTNNAKSRKSSFDNFSALIDSGNTDMKIPMNLIVFRNVRFDGISQRAYKNSGHSPISYTIDFSYEEAYIRDWAITKDFKSTS